MKIIHIADLHIGKIIYGMSLIDSNDQPAWITEFINFVKKEEPQAIVIAGDVYDRSNPPREAINEVDKFLTALSGLDFKPAVMMIAGNHDSGPLVEYLSGIAESQRIYFSGVASEKIKNVTLEDEYGPVDFWLVPYVFPAVINDVLKTDYRSYDEAYKAYLEAQDIDYSRRNVIISHQNITYLDKEAERGGSETMVGGVGGIDYSVFNDFEYAALGHIHAAQYVGRPEVRYAGSPLCYHFSELRHSKKGPVVVELKEKGKPAVIEVKEIKPLHIFREVSGTVEEIISKEKDNTATGEYIRATVKPYAGGSLASYADADDRLRALFRSHGSLLLDIEYEYVKYSTSDSSKSTSEKREEKPLSVQFADFWNQRLGHALDKDGIAVLETISEQTSNTTKKITNNSFDKLNEKQQDEIKAIVDFAKTLGGKNDETC